MNQQEHDDDAVRIAPVTYTPPGLARGSSPSSAIPPMYWVYGLLGLLLLIALALFSFSRAVRFDITPAAEHLDVSGGFGIAVADGRLLLPGSYKLHARKEGYEDLKASFVVGSEPEQTFRYEMKRLPGKLTVVTEPAGADLFVDGNPRGKTPVAAIELASGKHQLLLRAPRYLAFEADIEIEGGGIAQTFNARLRPGWAPVRIDSSPSGADVLIDGERVGRTPADLEVGGGKHEIKLELSGYRSWRDQITVRPNEPLKLARVNLAKADGNLQISSSPSGAAITVNGNYRGQSPLALTLAPGTTHEIRISAAGHRPASRSVSVRADAAEDLHVRLDPILGSVKLDVEPADAQIKIDGKIIAPGTREVQLTTTSHSVVAGKQGFITETVQVTPRESLQQTVRIRLRSNASASVTNIPARSSSKSGLQFILVKAGAFTMGSERGTQGRQSNEPPRKIRLTRAFYLASTEVTNAQFRKFRAAHSSGIHHRQTLDNERQPVVNVRWEEAVAFCNWLSSIDGLAPAYDNNKLTTPPNTGYRLPTEAEWEWAARFAAGGSLRYPWGSAMPPSPDSGNYADAAAEGAVPLSLQDYNDGYITTSPVASFPANALGLFDIGGNVAEWTHDFYTGLPSLGSREETDPMGPDSGRGHVIRGSSWAHGSLVKLRLAYRDFSSDRRPDVGFRVARYAE